MNRAEKYPETATFHFYNANPKNRITGDCTFRAISLALIEDYNNVVMEMAQHHCETGFAINDKKGISSYLKGKNWIMHKQPKHNDNTKYTGKQFAEWLSVNYPNGEIGNVVAMIGSHHITCFKPSYFGDGVNCRYKVFDIWDCTYGKIGNWWTIVDK